MQRYDSIIIGAGHNGLVTAAYLAKAGKKVLVLERRGIVGGSAATEEIYPGFKMPTCAHLASAFASAIIGDLALRQYGLELLPLDPLVFAPQPGGNALTIPNDQGQAVDAIGRFSQKDAAKFASFCALTRELSSFLRSLYGVTLPDHGTRRNVHLGELVKAGWKFHRLGAKQMYEFLRILPMSIADLLDEWFDTDLLKAAIGAPGSCSVPLSARASKEPRSCFCTTNSAPPMAPSERRALSAAASAISRRLWRARRGGMARIFVRIKKSRAL